MGSNKVRNQSDEKVNYTILTTAFDKLADDYIFVRFCSNRVKAIEHTPFALSKQQTHTIKQIRREENEKCDKSACVCLAFNHNMVPMKRLAEKKCYAAFSMRKTMLGTGNSFYIDKQRLVR